MGCTQSSDDNPVVTADNGKGSNKRGSVKSGSSVKGSKKKKSDTRKHHLADHMIVEFSGDVKDSYSVVKQIGEGSISNIYLVKRKDTAATTDVVKEVDVGSDGGTAKDSSTSTGGSSTETMYALKEIDMELVQDGFLDEMRNEIALLKTIDHPNILKAYSVYDQSKEKNKISIILELCSGGDLGKRAPYSESRTKHIVAKIVEAVNYLHLHGIMHRDLKFENIMFESEADDAEPKLIDFGLAQKYAKNSDHFHDKVGTVYTMSPQAIRGDYDKQTDLWSIGVVTYMLLVGDAPFWGDTRKEIATKVVQGKYSMEGPKWKGISKEAKDFIRNCLQVEPSLRYTAQKALKSPWLLEVRTEASATLRQTSTIALLNQMTATSGGGADNNTAESSEFRKLVLQTIAHKASSQEEIIRLREIFHALDVNHDGQITLQELRQGLKKVDLGSGDDEQARIEQWFQRADVDAGGEISYTEFIAALLETQGELHHDKVAEAFATLDHDHKGYITRQDLKESLGVSMDSAYLEQLLHEADANGDGKITFEEFQAVIHRRTSQQTWSVKENRRS